jgi:hypothetical protein
MLGITYESAHNEPPHPDPQVVSRLYEIAMSNCTFGCKIYADPRSNLRVLIHSAIYGCRK